MCGALVHFRFGPIADRESGHPQTVMSALPPKADMCSAVADVGYGPKADSCIVTNGLFDHLVSASKQWFGDREAQRFGGLEVDDQFDLC